MKSNGPKNTIEEGKADLDLIPWDILARHLPQAYEEGLIKYYKESWKLGFTTTSMYAAAMRHLIAYRSGEDYDPSAKALGVDKHHLAGALFSILCMLDTFDNFPELDDRNLNHKPNKTTGSGTHEIINTPDGPIAIRGTSKYNGDEPNE